MVVEIHAHLKCPYLVHVSYIQVALHDPGDIPDMDGIGFRLTPGFHTTVAVTRTDVSMTIFFPL